MHACRSESTLATFTRDLMPPRRKEIRKQREPESFESCMDAGVDQDERGERFSVGAKAERHYVKALSLYQLAAQFRPSSVDAWYNAARVQYVLGTQFHLPPDALVTLIESCRLYVEALERAPMPSDGIPSASRLDVLSNGGYALQALAEFIDEWGTMEMDAACIITAERAGIKLRTTLPTSLYMAAAMWFEQVIQGQELVLQQALVSITDPNAAHMKGPIIGDDRDDDAAEYTTSLVSPSSLLESLCDEVNVYLAILPQTHDSHELESVLSMARTGLERAEQYVQSLPPGYGASQSPTNEWDEQIRSLDMAALGMQVMAMEQAAEWGAWPQLADLEALETSIQERAAALLAEPPPSQSLTAVRLGAEAEARVKRYEENVSRLCDLGDYAHDLARLRIKLLASHVDAVSAEHAWSLCTCASKCVRAAVAALETPGSASVARNLQGEKTWVPRDTQTTHVAPATNTSTSVTRHRASMYMELSRISLTRCHDVLVAKYAPAAEARGQLLDHARIYARKALADEGLAWICQIHQLPMQPGCVCGGALMHAPANGGSESLAQDANVLWQYVRALWMRGATKRTPEGEQELRVALAAIWSLSFSSDAYHLVLADAKHLQDMLDNNAAVLSDDERVFWDTVWTHVMTSMEYDPFISHPLYE